MEGEASSRRELKHQAPHSCIEEKLAEQMAERPGRLMWVRGHQGEAGNEEADRGAKQEVCGWGNGCIYSR